jgi:hypothetical protein
MFAPINILVSGLFGPLTIRGCDQGAQVKAMDARNLPKLVKVALRTNNKVVKSPDELLK